jgi:23S rRNA pseudouridine2605 synthase
MSEGVRLNRRLAECGVASRRKAETLILEGRVTLEGRTVTDPGTLVSPGADLRVDGRLLAPVDLAYLVMNKPRGFLSAAADARRRTVTDLLPEEIRRLRVYPVGRLDLNSEGLLLLTNDGDFCRRISHPSSGITKRYHVRFDRPLNGEALDLLGRGIPFEGRSIAPLSVTLLEGERDRTWAEFLLAEGVNREIRRFAEAAGLSVVRLIRRGIGELVLRDLSPGEFRRFSREAIFRWIVAGGIV